MLLEGKSVVITGGGSGVGRAAALIFARNGAKVVCADIAADRVNAVVSEVRTAGGSAEPAICDVRNEGDVAAAIDKAVSAYGRLDVMFNNAGVYIAGGVATAIRDTLEECTLEEYEALTQVNFRGTFLGCKLAVRRFMAQSDRAGVIVNTASVAGLVGQGNVVYGATKGAVIQMSRSLAVEVAKHGIRVNAICPSVMLTNLLAFPGGEDKAAAEKAMGKIHPLGRPILPEDAANAALFLASDLARNITGVALPIDGGYVAA